ncbi:unnamed protein product [Arabidopsis lyrata]|uniref:TOD1/MUCI70 glycosyltransferase-like domain-containing protein n=1 Tax=Arabidopsis lyrata subsp. lyrata TaxID=81972 RepID=D7LCT0_ARALL|nr:hypothetical protein ARALYDRAFT_901337 [Arabidopsis lyrata subsp. lyrata]CAH8263658.1 unnamed protein product [Arabidopsis lyrata]
MVRETVSLHCGFFNANGGFRILDKDKRFMQTCEVVVSTCAFGGGDKIFMNLLECLRHQVKRFAMLRFGMKLLLQHKKQRGHKINENDHTGKWRIVIVKDMPFTDQRLTFFFQVSY